MTIDVVRHPRARGYRLRLDPRTGQAKLTIPKRARLQDALAWAHGQQEWLDRQRAQLPEPLPFVPGCRVPLGDEMLEIAWAEGGPRSPRRTGDTLLFGGPAESLAARVERWLRREALRVLSAETMEFAAKAGVMVSRVAVGDPRGRWGSCSSSGAIRYSWRLILAPAFVRRATVAHEVAHRVHMDHSPRFHRLVHQLLGEDPRPARDWLRGQGVRLHWYGRLG